MAHLRPEILRAVQDKLALFCTDKEIVADIAKEFGMSPRQIRHYIKTVRATWASAPDIDRDSRRNQLRQTAERLLRRAERAGHWKSALSALKVLIELDGVAEPAQLELNHAGFIFTDERLTGREAVTARIAQISTSATDEPN